MATLMLSVVLSESRLHGNTDQAVVRVVLVVFVPSLFCVVLSLILQMLSAFFAFVSVPFSFN